VARDQARTGALTGPSAGVGSGSTPGVESAPRHQPYQHSHHHQHDLLGKPPLGNHTPGATPIKVGAVGKTTSGFDEGRSTPAPTPGTPIMDSVWAQVSGGLGGKLTPSPSSTTAGGGPATPASALTKSLLTSTLHPLRRIDSGLLHNTIAEASPGSPSDARKRLTPDDFEMLCLVGQGAFGKVFQVRKKDSGAVYAVGSARSSSHPSLSARVHTLRRLVISDISCRSSHLGPKPPPCQAMILKP